MFSCRSCKVQFEKSFSLGGHIAKAHPGKSENYIQKMKIRVSRAEDRAFLVKAKEWYKQHEHILMYSGNKSQLNPLTFPRSKITQIKKILQAGE